MKCELCPNEPTYFYYGNYSHGFARCLTHKLPWTQRIFFEYTETEDEEEFKAYQIERHL